MKIAFHGSNAMNFRPGFENLLEHPHRIVELSGGLDRPGERDDYVTSDVIIGIRLGATEPHPAKVKLYHAPAAGIDGIDRSRLPPAAVLCNCFGHENAIAEYVMAALLLQYVPLLEADKGLREGRWDLGAGGPRAIRTELGARTIGLLGF